MSTQFVKKSFFYVQKERFQESHYILKSSFIRRLNTIQAIVFVESSKTRVPWTYYQCFAEMIVSRSCLDSLTLNGKWSTHFTSTISIVTIQREVDSLLSSSPGNHAKPIGWQRTNWYNHSMGCLGIVLLDTPHWRLPLGIIRARNNDFTGSWSWIGELLELLAKWPINVHKKLFNNLCWWTRLGWCFPVLCRSV